MFPDEIQKRALKTWYAKDDPMHLAPLHPTLAMAGEAGELADQLKKHLWKPGIEVSRDEFLEELGDLLYYVAIRAYQLRVTMDQLSQLNREKIRNGKNGWPENGEE